MLPGTALDRDAVRPLGRSRAISRPTSRRRWRVVRTRSNGERELAKQLYSRRVSYFLPLRPVLIRSGRTLKQSQKVLFPGYLFCYGDQDTIYRIKETRLSAGIIETDEQRRLYNELSAIATAIAAPESTAIDPYTDLVPGRRCVVQTGPFQGFEGTIVSRPEGKAKLILSITMLGQAVTCDIDPSTVELTTS